MGRENKSLATTHSWQKWRVSNDYTRHCYNNRSAKHSTNNTLIHKSKITQHGAHQCLYLSYFDSQITKQKDTQMVDLEKLRAELAIATAASNEQLTNMTEARRITAQIELVKDPKMQEARVSAEIDRINTQQLDDIILKAGIIVDSKPVMDTRRRENRKFSPSRFFGLGAQIDKVYQVLTGVLYSTDAHKPELLTLTNLDTNLIETTVEAFGTPRSYYNGTERPEVPANVSKLRPNLALISTKMGLTLDLSNITSTRMNAIFAQAQAKYAKDKASHELTLAAESQVLDLTPQTPAV